MGLFSSKSSSSNRTDVRTTNTDKRIATAGEDIVFQQDAEYSTINFEDVNEDVVQSGLNLAGLFIDSATRLVENTQESAMYALGSTNQLTQNLFEEKNTPGTDNIKQIVLSLAGAGVLIAWILRK